jgi:O-antigen/teichoic acid export membrane protein
LGGFASDTLYVGAWQAAASVADLIQIGLLVHALGLRGYGQFALVVAFVALVGQFFDLRMTTATTAVAARHLAADQSRAVGIFRFSYWMDVLLGILALCCVLILAPLIGPGLVGRHAVELIAAYALVLVVASPDDTSVTVLRLLDRFRLAAMCGVAAEVLRVALVWGALQLRPDLTYALLALVVAAAVRAALNAAAAFRATTAWQPHLRLFGKPNVRRDDRREVLSMVVHTNVASYARLAMTQLPTLLLGAIAGATQVGIYKVGMAIAAGLGRIADPAMAAIFPRITKLWDAGQYRAARLLVYRATVIAVVIVGIAMSLMIFFRDELARLIVGGHPSKIGTIVVLGLVGQAINGVFFWNAQALFASRRARTVGVISVAGAMVQIAILVLLAPSSGAHGAAVAFLVAQVFINAALTLTATRILRTNRPSALAKDNAVPAREHGEALLHP